MSTSTERFIKARIDSLADDLSTVFAGGDGFDESAVHVAEYLVALAGLVEEWAATPGPHGGNPRVLPHVKAAEFIIEWNSTP